MWVGLKPAHVGLVARFASKFAIRTGGGLIFLLILLLTGLGVAQLFVWPVEAIVAAAQRPMPGAQPVTAGEVVRQVAEAQGVRDFVGWVVGGDRAQTSYLLGSNPALLSAILLTLLMLFPFLACFGGFNQTSGDIQSRGLRYLLLRTERVNIFLGRFLGVVFFTGVYVAGLMAVVLAYVGFRFKLYDAGSLLSWGGQGYVALVLLALPYVALCSWISAAIDSPFGSLIMCLMLVGLPIVFIRALSGAVGGDYDALTRILPWGWKYELLHGDLPTRLLAMAVVLGFTALFLLLGLRSFRKRDL